MLFFIRVIMQIKSIKPSAVCGARKAYALVLGVESGADHSGEQP